MQSYNRKLFSSKFVAISGVFLLLPSLSIAQPLIINGDNHCSYQSISINSTGSVSVLCQEDSGGENPVVVNRPPVVFGDNGITDEGKALTVNVLLNDSDPDGDSLSITGVSSPANGVASIESGQVRYVPESGFDGTDTFSYTVSDGRGLSASGVVTITVKDDVVDLDRDNDGEIDYNIKKAYFTIDDVYTRFSVNGNRLYVVNMGREGKTSIPNVMNDRSMPSRLNPTSASWRLGMELDQVYAVRIKMPAIDDFSSSVKILPNEFSRGLARSVNAKYVLSEEPGSLVPVSTDGRCSFDGERGTIDLVSQVRLDSYPFYMSWLKSSKCEVQPDKLYYLNIITRDPVCANASAKCSNYFEVRGAVLPKYPG